MAPIGIFDSGFGGLSIFREIHQLLPQYDYIFLGDNQRAPYGDRSFDEVFAFTKQAVDKLFDMGCPLVILACNTASAKALRNIQQRVLPYSSDPSRRVLGVIRPTVERVGEFTYSGHIGLIATRATISSESYDMEIEKIPTSIRLDFKPLVVNSQACPTWVPMIEAGLQDTDEMHDAVYDDLKQLLDKDPLIDTIILGCTHYPFLVDAMKEIAPRGIRFIDPAPAVARHLTDVMRKDGIALSRGTENGSPKRPVVKLMSAGDPKALEALFNLIYPRR